MEKDVAVFHSAKGSWSNDELRTVERAYELVLRRRSGESDLSPYEREKIAARVMRLARDGFADAEDLARRCLEVRRNELL